MGAETTGSQKTLKISGRIGLKCLEPHLCAVCQFIPSTA